MTPRSRKPITAIESLSSENKSHAFESLLEESEDDSPLLIGTSIPINSESNDLLEYVEGIVTRIDTNQLPVTITTAKQGSLTDTFKEYLMSRSGLIPSSLDDDSSFTSQPDDFVDDIKDISESEMSESMLYCLDGNTPLIESDQHLVSGCLNKKRSLNSDDSEDIVQESLSKKAYVCTIGETNL